MRAQKLLLRHFAALQNHLNVVVARGPHAVEEFGSGRFGQRRDCVAQLIQRLPQRRAPLLVPAAVAAIAAAVRAPALHAMHAAPRSVVGNFALVLRWKLLQEVRVVGQLYRLVVLNQPQSIGQGHFAVAMMMPIGLAVGRHVH